MIDYLYFRLIYDYLNQRIETAGQTIMANFMAWTSAIALTLVTLWIIMHGYRIVTGQSREPMMGLVVSATKIVLIISVATSMSIFGTDLHQFFQTDLDQAINGLLGSSGTTAETIDRNLAYTQIAEGAIDWVQVPEGDLEGQQSKSTAIFFATAGVSSPPMAAGALLLLFQFTMTLFIGLGPLFILCLIFPQTQDLFRRWLLYGIGTLFSMATLSVVSAIALNLTINTAIALWSADLINVFTGSGSEGLSNRALEQGGIGLFMTLLIVSVPVMAARFFAGTVGNFMPFSAFGQGALPSHGAASSHGIAYGPSTGTHVPLADAPVPTFQARAPSTHVADQIKTQPTGATGHMGSPTDAQLAVAINTDPAYWTANVGAPAPGTGVSVPPHHHGAQDEALWQKGYQSNLDSQHMEAQAKAVNAERASMAQAAQQLQTTINDKIKREGNEFMQLQVQLAFAGGSGGLLSGGLPLLGAAYDGTKVGSILQFMAASRGGAAVSGATVNTAAQLVQHGGHISQINPVDVGVSAITAGLGVGGGTLWNIGVGTAGGALQAETNNVVYGQHDNVVAGAALGGIATGAGFLTGEKLTGVWNAQSPTSLNPVIGGNIAGSATSESMNSFVEELQGRKKKDESGSKN